MRTVTRWPARIAAARTGRPPRLTVPPVDTMRSTSTAAPGLSGAGAGGGRRGGGAGGGGGGGGAHSPAARGVSAAGGVGRGRGWCSGGPAAGGGEAGDVGDREMGAD